METVVLNFRLMLFTHQKLMALLMCFLHYFLPYLFINFLRKESRLISCVEEVLSKSTLIRETVAQCFWRRNHVRCYLWNVRSIVYSRNQTTISKSWCSAMVVASVRWHWWWVWGEWNYLWHIRTWATSTHVAERTLLPYLWYIHLLPPTHFDSIYHSIVPHCSSQLTSQKM
jgi:hypothetical protein